MNIVLKTVFVGLASLAAGVGTFGQAQARPVKTGALECRVAPGIGFIFVSRKEVSCRFTSRRGRVEYYRGEISKLGIDIGVTGGGILVWGVYEPTHHPGSLGGHYAGASAEATVFAGLGANLLIGGSRDSVALQPLSVQGQMGLNISAGIGELVLYRVR